mmetsp:Transcript_27843/g.80426  ORF Transcript_27843/g.80426 Transcript_27843/m.80426 type:complete len:234 (+) Transcript_27843:655-1356(+)
MVGKVEVEVEVPFDVQVRADDLGGVVDQPFGANGLLVFGCCIRQGRLQRTTDPTQLGHVRVDDVHCLGQDGHCPRYRFAAAAFGVCCRSRTSSRELVAQIVEAAQYRRCLLVKGERGVIRVQQREALSRPVLLPVGIIAFRFRIRLRIVCSARTGHGAALLRVVSAAEENIFADARPRCHHAQRHRRAVGAIARPLVAAAAATAATAVGRCRHGHEAWWGRRARRRRLRPRPL